VLVVGGGDAPATSVSSAAAAAQNEDDGVKPADERSSVTADAGRGSSVVVGLRTGHFDADNVKLLRTCSEPDLSCVCRPSDTKMSRHSREGSLTNISHQEHVIAHLVSLAFVAVNSTVLVLLLAMTISINDTFCRIFDNTVSFSNTFNSVIITSVTKYFNFYNGR